MSPSSNADALYTPAAVRAACQAVADAAECVQIDATAIETWGEQFRLDALTLGFPPELRLSSDDPEELARFALLCDGLNFSFFPDSSDLVLLQLEDGLYVTEIDDRAWQNTQLLYPGENFSVVVENDSIYILENDRYFEIITEIEPA